MFLSTYENKLDKKGRVSVPAGFRSHLSNLGYNGVICYQTTGVLLPHLFTLALMRRFIFCGTIPRVSPARHYLAPVSYTHLTLPTKA